MNTLRSFIKGHYGSTSECARKLGITPQAIVKWWTDSPRNALRYIPEFCQQTGSSPSYFVRVVLMTEDELKWEPPKEELKEGAA